MSFQASITLAAIFPAASLILSQFLIIRIVAATTAAATAAITNVVGLSSAPTALMAVAIFGAVFRTTPTPLVSFPTPVSNGPMAAATAATRTAIFFCAGLSLLIQVTTFCRRPTMDRTAGMSISPTEMARPSAADLSSVSWPLRLSSCVSAICWAAPEESLIAVPSSSKRSADVPSSALTAARSVLLKMPESIVSFASWDMSPMPVWMSPMMSGMERMLPSAS